MKSERLRRKTFSSQICPAALAYFGFYSIDESDAVQCAFCDGILSCWNQDDDPAEQHKLHFGCDYNPKKDDGRHMDNVLPKDEEQNHISIRDADWPSLTLLSRQRQDEVTIMSLNFNLDSNLFDHATDRDKTFEHFGAVYVDKHKAAEAGFFGVLFRPTRTAHAVCHSCGIVLIDFKKHNDYWAAHARLRGILLSRKRRWNKIGNRKIRWKE